MSVVRHWLIMTVLSFSGGIIFLLPFLQEVYYIPLADALGLNNTEVGSLMSVFGTTSLIVYFPGGWLADRVSPRKLITFSLFTTGAIGLYFATFPSYTISLVIHAVWGVNDHLPVLGRDDSYDAELGAAGRTGQGIWHSRDGQGARRSTELGRIPRRFRGAG